MSSETDRSIHVTQQFSHPPDRVFDAWISPADIRLWFAPELGPLERVEVDARVGGRFSIAQRREGELVDHVGEYFVVDRPNHLVFTFGIVGFGEGAPVDIRFEPNDAGTRMDLRSELPPEFAAYVERTREGWTTLSQNIENLLSGN